MKILSTTIFTNGKTENREVLTGSKSLCVDFINIQHNTNVDECNDCHSILLQNKLIMSYDNGITVIWQIVD